MIHVSRHRVIAIAAALALAAGASALVGCGGSDQGTGTTTTTQGASTAATNGVEALSADEIVKRSLAAAKAATSATVKGTASNNGQAVGIDLTLTRGTGGSGSLTIGGQKVEIINAAGKSYLRAPAAFWAKAGIPQTVSDLLADRWITAPATGSSAVAFSGFAQFTDMAVIVDGLLEGIVPTDVGQRTMVDGQPAVTVLDKDGNSLAVSVTGEPYPLRFTEKTGKPGDVVFSGWNKAATVTPPADAVDFAKITG